MQIGAYRTQQIQQPQHQQGGGLGQGNFQGHTVQLTQPQANQPGGQANQATGPDPAKYKQLMKASPQVKASNAAKAVMKSAPTISDKRLLLDPKTLKAEMGRDPRVIGSDKYKAVLTAVEQYNKLTTDTISANAATRQQQVDALTTAIDKAIDRIDAHVEAHEDQPMISLKNELVKQKLELLNIEQQGPPANMAPSFKELLAVRALGMPDSACADFVTRSEQTEAGKAKALGSGGVNTTHKIPYKDGQVMVFKAMRASDPQMPGQASAVGIDAGSPRYANRNVATYEMSQALGLDLIPKSGFATHGNQVGLVMDLVSGRSPRDSDPRPLPLTTGERDMIISATDDIPHNKGDTLLYIAADKGLEISGGIWEKHTSIADQFSRANNPQLTLKLTQLEWLDNICGQVDRHPGNYMIDISPNGAVSLKGIDNDYSFGATHKDPSQRVSSNSKLNGFPPLIDGDTAQAMRDLQTNWNQPGGMKAKLEGLNLIKPEVDATKARLDALVNHITTLQGQGKVVPTNQWATWQDGNGASAHAILAQGSSYVATLDREGQDAYQQKHAAGLV